MKARAEYEAAVKIIRGALNEWDPFSLIANGAPSDEFETEASKVAAHIFAIHSAQDAASVISAVFSRAFEAKTFAPADCVRVGESLYKRLRAAGLVHAQPGVQADRP